MTDKDKEVRGYYTWEELIELGCPPQLVIQYIFMDKDWIEKETGLRLEK